MKALEAEGLAIREAGTHQRPSAEVFTFNPAPTSPIYPNFARNSLDSPLRDKTRRDSWRGSTASLASVTRGTQTDDDDGKGSTHSPSIGTHSPARKETEHLDDKENHHDDLSEDDDHEEHAEIATATPVVARARMVAVPKRVPPSLPPRNPERMSILLAEVGDGFDQVSLDGTPSKHEEHAKPAGEPTNDLYDHSKAPEHETKHGDDDDFHSMPVTPAEEENKGVPSPFN